MKWLYNDNYHILLCGFVLNVHKESFVPIMAFNHCFHPVTYSKSGTIGWLVDF